MFDEGDTVITAPSKDMTMVRSDFNLLTSRYGKLDDRWWWYRSNNRIATIERRYEVRSFGYEGSFYLVQHPCDGKYRSFFRAVYYEAELAFYPSTEQLEETLAVYNWLKN
jgi:hypothetical protein